MQVQWHRVVENLLAPLRPLAPVEREMITGVTPQLHRDKLDLANLAAMSTGIPAIHLMDEVPAVLTEGLTLPFYNEMTIRRGFQTEAVIRSSGQRIEVDRPGLENDKILQHSAQRVEIDRHGWSDDATITRQNQQVQVRIPSLNRDVLVSRSGNQTRIQRQGNEGNFTITQNGQRTDIRHDWDANSQVSVDASPSQILIDRPGIDQDVRINQSPQRIEIDRWGVDRDVVVTQRGNQIEIDRWGSHNDLSIRYSADRIELRHSSDSNKNSVIRRYGNQVVIDRGNSFNNVTYSHSGQELKITRWGRQSEVVISGAVGQYNLQEAGLTIGVRPEGLVLKSIQLDHELDLSMN